MMDSWAHTLAHTSLQNTFFNVTLRSFFSRSSIFVVRMYMHKGEQQRSIIPCTYYNVNQQTNRFYLFSFSKLLIKQDLVYEHIFVTKNIQCFSVQEFLCLKWFKYMVMLCLIWLIYWFKFSWLSQGSWFHIFSRKKHYTLFRSVYWIYF